MNRFFASVLILFLTALSVAAQEFTVSGTVYDDRDRPMEFVSVVQKDLFISTYNLTTEIGLYKGPISGYNNIDR